MQLFKHDFSADEARDKNPVINVNDKKDDEAANEQLQLPVVKQEVPTISESSGLCNVYK